MCLPISQFGRDLSIWFFEIVTKTIRVLTAHKKGGEDVPQLVLTGPGGGEMVKCVNDEMMKCDDEMMKC